MSQLSQWGGGEKKYCRFLNKFKLPGSDRGFLIGKLYFTIVRLYGGRQTLEPKAWLNLGIRWWGEGREEEGRGRGGGKEREGRQGGRKGGWRSRRRLYFCSESRKACAIWEHQGGIQASEVVPTWSERSYDWCRNYSSLRKHLYFLKGSKL